MPHGYLGRVDIMGLDEMLPQTQPQFPPKKTQIEKIPKTKNIMGARKSVPKEVRQMKCALVWCFTVTFRQTRPNTRHASRRRLREGVMDGRTNGRTDRPSHRDARTHLKSALTQPLTE